MKREISSDVRAVVGCQGVTSCDESCVSLTCVLVRKVMSLVQA